MEIQNRSLRSQVGADLIVRDPLQEKESVLPDR